MIQGVCSLYGLLGLLIGIVVTNTKWFKEQYEEGDKLIIFEAYQLMAISLSCFFWFPFWIGWCLGRLVAIFNNNEW